MHTDPLALFAAAVDAVGRQDWQGLAQLCDAASLAELCAELRARVSARPTPDAPFTTADLHRTNPSMPRAVAEWQAERVREHHDPDRRLREEFPGVASRDALQRLSPAEVFAAWFDGHSPGRLAERAYGRRQITRAAFEAMLDAEPARVEYVVLGSAPDGEAIRYVFYRQNLPGSRPQAAMLRRQPDGGWLLVAARDLLMIDPVAALRTGFTPEPDVDA